jgi:hypothetical protein
MIEIRSREYTVGQSEMAVPFSVQEEREKNNGYEIKI